MAPVKGVGEVSWATPIKKDWRTVPIKEKADMLITANKAGMDGGALYFKGFDIGTWFGVLAPAATPKDVVAKLNAEMARIIRSPEFGERMRAIGADPIGDSPADMAARIREETTKFAKLVKDGKVTIE